MASIFYEDNSGDVCQVDEISQRILVYVHLYGQTRSEDVVDPANAENKHLVNSRIENQLGPTAASLIKTETSNQMTLDGEIDDTIYYVLSEKGIKFVKKHRDELSMPVEVARLAKRVARIQIENGLVEDLIHRINTLEDRVDELEN